MKVARSKYSLVLLSALERAIVSFADKAILLRSSCSSILLYSFVSRVCSTTSFVWKTG
jgi:hypothetical protein